MDSDPRFDGSSMAVCKSFVRYWGIYDHRIGRELSTSPGTIRQDDYRGCNRRNEHATDSDLKRFSVPLLVIVGDEDEPCIDGSVFLKRTVPTAGLLVIPRSSHNVPSEDPAAFNAALAELFAAAEAGRWLAHRPAT